MSAAGTRVSPTAGTRRRSRAARRSQTLAERQARRLARFQDRVHDAKTPDELVAAAALYVRGYLTDLPPIAAERVAQDAVSSLQGIVDRHLNGGRSR
jgi:hypothetical protein